MLTGKWIGTTCQGVKEIAVEQVAFCKVAEGGVAGKLSRREEILGHNERLVVGWIFLPNTIVDLGRQQWFGAGEDTIESILRERHVAEGRGIDQASEVFIEGVAGPQIRFGAQDALVVRAKCDGKPLNEIVDLLMAG